MLKRYVLRWKRNLDLERESGKKELWLEVGELGNVLEKVLIDFCKLFQSIGAAWLNELLDILREDVEGQSRVRWSADEPVEPVCLIFINFLKYWGRLVRRRL